VNTSFPQPFRGVATLEQKAFVVAFVAMRRGGLLQVEGD